MKELIIQALDAAFLKTNAQIPQTKKVQRDIDIMDINPIDLLTFMKENGVPDDANFGGRNNGYDGYDDFILYWFVDVPTTTKDHKQFAIKHFTNVAFKMIFDVMTANGYKRVGVNTSEFSKFKNFNIYELYLNGQIDLIVEYYSLYFKKIVDNVG